MIVWAKIYASIYISYEMNRNRNKWVYSSIFKNVDYKVYLREWNELKIVTLQFIVWEFSSMVTFNFSACFANNSNTHGDRVFFESFISNVKLYDTPFTNTCWNICYIIWICYVKVIYKNILYVYKRLYKKSLYITTKIKSYIFSIMGVCQ